MIALYPSLSAADQLNLAAMLDKLDPYADGYHLDIMDFHFVPHLHGSLELIAAIAAQTSRPLWLHLMVDNPATWIESLPLPEDSIVTIHIEATKDPLRILHAIQRHGWSASIALNPTTPVAQVLPCMHQLDQLLLMSVSPGRSGQPFIASTMQKIEMAQKYKQAHNLALHLAVDGGITPELLPTLRDAGIQDVAIGSALFNSD